MKKYLKSVVLAAILALCMPSLGRAVSAPTGLAVTPWASGGTTLTWLTDTAATSWYIYIGGVKSFSPDRFSVTNPTPSTYAFNVTGISQQSLPAIITMKSLGGGQVSAISSPITVTAVGPVPFVYVQTAPGTFLSVSGSTGGGGGSASAVTVISSVLPTGASTEATLSALNAKVTTVNTGAVVISSSALPTGAATSALQTSGNSTLTTINSNLSNVTVNAHAVTQGSPWTVSGSVDVTSFPSSFLGVSVKTGVAGISVTASQGSPFTVSGSVGVTSFTGGFLGVSVQSGVGGISTTANVTQFGGTNISTGTGTGGAGIPRVTLSSDSSLAANQSVNVAQMNGVATTMGNGVAGTGVQRVVIASDNTANSNPWLVGGNVANDAVDSGNPNKIGGQARTSLPTAVANADRVNAMYDVFGRNVTLIGGPRDLITQNTVTITTTTETTFLTAVASTFLDITLLSIASTGNQDVRIDFRDATGGSVVLSVYIPTGNVSTSVPVIFPVKQTTVNNNWTAQLSTAAGTTSVRIFAQALQNR